MEILLAIDTSFGKFSIVIYRGGDQLAYFENEEYTKQAEMLIPEIEALLAANDLTYQDLSKIAVCTGPGSFTGLRIGIAAVKGLDLALEIDTVGVTSLEASAISQGGGKVYLNANRGEAYFQEFDADCKPLNEAKLIEYEAEEYSPQPNADLVAQAVLKGISRVDISPLYIRKPDAKLPTKRN